MPLNMPPDEIPYGRRRVLHRAAWHTIVSGVLGGVALAAISFANVPYVQAKPAGGVPGAGESWWA